MIRNIFRVFFALLLIAGLVCAFLGFQKLQASWPLDDEAGRLFKEADAVKQSNRFLFQQKEQQGLKVAGQANDLRQPGEQLLALGGIVGGVGLLGLVLPPIVGAIVRRVRPKRSFANVEELIAAETSEQLRPGEHILNQAVVIRGWGARWSPFCAVLTTQRLLLFNLRRSWLVGLRIFKAYQEEYDTDQIIGCTTDQHWKGRDVIFEFPSHQLLLRLAVFGPKITGQDEFWTEVPARFAGRARTPGQIVEEKLRKRLVK